MSKDQKGFTLIEIIVILAVLSILAAVAVPMVLRIFERTAEDTTREEMDNIKKALLGDPQKLQSSFRSDFGFLGDIGCLPTAAFPSAPALDRLSTQGTLPGWSFNPTQQAGAGWKGPYITGTAGEEFAKDQWGNNYTYTATGVCPLMATLKSDGPGQSTSADDITVDIVANETTATVRGTVKDAAGVGLEAVDVEYYSAANNGTLTTTTATTDANGNYSVSLAPFGQRAVRALPRLVYAPGSAVRAGNSVTFDIINYSQSAQVVDRMRLDYVQPPAPNFNRIRIDNLAGGWNICFSSGGPGTSAGTVVLLTCAAGQRTVAASPAARPSMRVFIDSPDTKLPDTTITGQGTKRTIEIRFVANPANTPLTVTFNAPPSVLPISVGKFTVPP